MVNTTRVLQPTGIGFRTKERKLHPLMAVSYDKIIGNAAFREVSSESIARVSLSSRVTGYVCVPTNRRRIDGVVVYFHGAGGNGAWNVELMIDLFPKHLIFCPSLGFNCTKSDSESVHNWIQDAAEALDMTRKVSSKKLTIVFLSDGRLPAEDFLEAYEDEIDSVLGLSSCPPNKSMYGEYPMLMISGENDQRFTASNIKKYTTQRTKAGHETGCVIIEDADHFMVLSHRKSLLRSLSKSTLFSES